MSRFDSLLRVARAQIVGALRPCYDPTDLVQSVLADSLSRPGGDLVRTGALVRRVRWKAIDKLRLLRPAVPIPDDLNASCSRLRAIDERDESATLPAMLVRLDSEQRAVVQLMREGRQQSEIAQALNLTIDQVRYRVRCSMEILSRVAR